MSFSTTDDRLPEILPGLARLILVSCFGCAFVALSIFSVREAVIHGGWWALALVALLPVIALAVRPDAPRRPAEISIDYEAVFQRLPALVDSRAKFLVGIIFIAVGAAGGAWWFSLIGALLLFEQLAVIQPLAGLFSALQIYGGATLLAVSAVHLRGRIIVGAFFVLTGIVDWLPLR